jgi:hypothetical protein
MVVSLSSPPNVFGSGIGPFIAHRLCSYLALIHPSMLLSEGFLSFKLASQYLDEKKIHVSLVFISGQGSILQQSLTYFAALALPHFTILST